MAAKDAIKLIRKFAERLPRSIFHRTSRPLMKWRQPLCTPFQGGWDARHSLSLPVASPGTKTKMFVRDLTTSRETGR